MTRHPLLLSALVVTLFAAGSRPAAGQSELDAVWAEMSRTVAEGDFEGYAALYHDDAVLVSESAGTSYPIAQALAGWKQGFDDTRDGKARAGVELRITRTLGDGTTAHQTGMFRYSFHPEGGEASAITVHFEALLVKKDRWLMLMEYQQQAATDEEWEAAR
jgi:ketosteroid isomerase-like protein